MFYIEKDKKIVLFDEDKNKLEKTIKFMPQYAGLEIKETKRLIDEFKFSDTKAYKNEKKISDLKEQINKLETEYGMCRWQREMILANGSTASDYAKAKAQEIETLAEELRG